MDYRVAEIFTSINGEGLKAGKLACFIRLAGCPLSCSYCDTAWARDPIQGQMMSLESILEVVLASKASLVTLTGGEPLSHLGVDKLIEGLLAIEGLEIEIETSGAVATTFLADLRTRDSRLCLTLDYKLRDSGMSAYMVAENYQTLRTGDAVKYVISSPQELGEVLGHIQGWQPQSPEAEILLSSVYGNLPTAQLVDWLKSHADKSWQAKCRVQLQLHKYIWEPTKRGV